MSFKPFFCAAFALSALVGAQAQTRSPAASQPQGEASLPSQYKGAQPRGSVESRADVKAKAIEARKDGSIQKGEASTPRQAKGPRPATSEKSRSDVKAEAAAANKAGTMPKGEESQKGQAGGTK